MKTNVLKKVLAMVSVLLLCLSLAACGGNESPEQSDTNPESSSQSENSSQAEVTSSETTVSQEKQPIYYYAAIEGAVIVEQDGTQHYVYCYKCEKCNTVQDNIKHNQYGGGSLLTSYFCPNCKKSQSVKIEESVSR